MHGSAAQEIALLCKHSGVEMSVPLEGNPIIRTLVKLGDKVCLGPAGALFIEKTEELRDKLASGYFNAVFLSAPQQIDDFNKNIRPLNGKVPFVIRHGLNSFEKFKKLGVKNFLSPSQRAIDNMQGCHCFLNRKLVPWDMFPKALPSSYSDEREGLFQYIHYFQRWPEAVARFDKLCSLCEPLKIITYGYESPNGVVDDLSKMGSARATIHVKDGQVVCNSVIRSMALGTPVLMDQLTFDRCFFDQIQGIQVFDTIEKMAESVKRLASDDSYEEELCKQTYDTAKKQFSFTEELGERFRYFIQRLRV